MFGGQSVVPWELALFLIEEVRYEVCYLSVLYPAFALPRCLVLVHQSLLGASSDPAEASPPIALGISPRVTTSLST